MLHLVCVPMGFSAMETFSDMALAQGFDKAILVTSSRFLVQKARLRGVNAANFDYLANAVLRQCGRSNVRKISRRTQELVIRGILEKMLREGRLRYFADLASKKGFLRSMTALTDQLGSCGATPEEIETAFSHWDGRAASCRQKDLEVAEVYREYLSYLIGHNLSDVQGLYRIAAEELSGLQDLPGAFFCESLFFTGFYRFDTLQLEIIQRLSRFLDVWVALPYESRRPELYGAAAFTYGTLMGYAVREHFELPDPSPERPPSLRHVLQSLGHPGSRPVAAGEGIEILKTPNKSEEVRAVLRDIKLQIRERAVRPDEIAVVVRHMDEYSGIRALGDEYGVPVQMADTAALSANPLFQYVLAVLRMVTLHGREKAEACIRFLSLPLQRFVLGLHTESVIRAAAQRYYADDKTLLDTVFAFAENELRPLWQEIEQIPSEATVAEYCDKLSRLLSSLSLLQKAGLQYQQGKTTLNEFKNIACASEAVNAVLQSLPLDYSSGGLADRVFSCAAFAEVLSEAAEGETILLSPENGEGVWVLSAANLEETSFKQVFVLGLQEDRFPFLKKENWIYNDRERNELSALGITLPSGSDGYKEDIHFFANACGAATERLVLTFSTEDDRLPSPYINEIMALFSDLKIQKKTPVRHVEESLSRKELELSLARLGMTGPLAGVTDPVLVEAGQSDRKRLGKEDVRNGRLADPALAERIRQNIGDHFSASKLESFRRCPFQFLVKYGWRQQETEAAEEDVSPGQRGNILHAVLERFIRRHTGEKLTVSNRDKLLDELDVLFDGVCVEMAENGSLYAGEFWNFDREQLRLALRRWLEQEIDYSERGNLRPLYTEKEFGRNKGEIFCLESDRGERIFLNGKIDRIDKAGEAYYITDYKSGKVPGKKDFLDSDLQMPLYILAAEEVFAKPAGATVVGGGYYSLKDGERGNSFLFPPKEGADIQIPWKTWREKKDADGNSIRFDDTAALREKLEEFLSEMMQDMRNGRYTPTPFAECDTYCPAARICRFAVLSPGCGEEESDG